jgi:pheromone a factor receptor
MKVFKSESTVFIFEELVTGGDLYSYIEYRGGRVGEAEGGAIMRQTLEAVKYLHDRDIVHRDIKPDNILVAALAQGARVVLTDFGSAVQRTDVDGCGLQMMRTIAGTLEYAAP